MYRIAGGQALYRGSLTYTSPEIAARRGRIEISGNAFARMSRTALAGAPETLLALLDSLPGTAAGPRDHLRRVRGRAWAADVRVARIAGLAGSLLRSGRSVVFDVAPGRRLVALGDTVIRRTDNDISWHGVLSGAVFGSVDLVLTTKGITATLRADTVVYVVEPLGNGFHSITRIDQGRVPPPHPLGSNPLGADSVTGSVSNRSPDVDEVSAR